MFPVTHSILSAEALAKEVVREHDLGAPISCRLLHRGLNDTYEVARSGMRRILRVYRHAWRTHEEVLFELELLLHLADRGVPVSTPIARRNGALVWQLEAPEGLRHAVLFTDAPGRSPQVNDANLRHFGALVAAVHTASDDFTSTRQRPVWDLSRLLDQALVLAEPLLRTRPEDRERVVSLSNQLKEQARRLPLQHLDWGICHGDLNLGNVHASQNGELTLFDFDFCGFGWRAMDLAVQRLVMLLNQRDEALWQSFLEGYVAKRPLREIDHAAIPFFVQALSIWELEFVIQNAADFGRNWMMGRLEQTLVSLRRPVP